MENLANGPKQPRKRQKFFKDEPRRHDESKFKHWIRVKGVQLDNVLRLAGIAWIGVAGLNNAATVLSAAPCDKDGNPPPGQDFCRRDVRDLQLIRFVLDANGKREYVEASVKDIKTAAEKAPILVSEPKQAVRPTHVPNSAPVKKTEQAKKATPKIAKETSSFRPFENPNN
jgi:hypothetical protein